MCLVTFVRSVCHISRQQCGHKRVSDDIFGPIFEKVKWHLQTSLSIKIYTP